MLKRIRVAVAALAVLFIATSPLQSVLAFNEDSGMETMAQGAYPDVDLADAASHQRSLAQERAAIINGNAIPAWRGRMDTVYGRSYMAPASSTNKCTAGQVCTGLIPGKSFPYEDYIVDPTTSTGRPVMQVWYPKGAWSAGGGVAGGTLFYLFPYKWSPKDVADPFSQYGATLEYEVYIPADFDWVKGGKLPGFGGGKDNGRGCGGGADPAECFSYRIMWRRNGWGEAYLYVPHYMQAPDFCGLPNCNGTKFQPCTVCDYEAGVSFYRGAFVFQLGAWNKLKLGMKLNTPNVTDGVLTLDFNGQRVIDYRSMNWRQYPNVYVEGLTFATWYGGSDVSWAPPKDNYLLFRNIKMYYDGPGEGARAANTGGDMPSDPPPGWTGPVDIVAPIQESPY